MNMNGVHLPFGTTRVEILDRLVHGVSLEEARAGKGITEIFCSEPWFSLALGAAGGALSAV